MLEVDEPGDRVPITIEKTRLNLFNVGGLILVVISQLVGGAVIWTNLNRDVAEIRQAQIENTTTSARNYEDMKTQTAPVPALKFQQDQLTAQLDRQAAAIADTNKRFDRMIELVSGKLDGLNQNMNDLRTEVRVLAQEVRSDKDKAKPTAFVH